MILNIIYQYLEKIEYKKRMSVQVERFGNL